MWELAACKDTRKSVAFADFAEGPTPREARSGVVTPLPTELTIRDARAGAFLEPRGPLTKRTLRVPLSAVASAASPRGRPQAPRTANRPTPRCRRRKRAEIRRAPPPQQQARNAGRATMASFAGSSKDTVADLLVDKSASPPPGAKPAKAPDTEKKHYSNNNDGETMEALLEGAIAASRRNHFIQTHRLQESRRGVVSFRF